MEKSGKSNLLELTQISKNQILSEFQQLQKLGTKPSKYQYPEIYECKHSQKPLNRYCNVLPYQHNRVTSGLQNDYINGSFMKLIYENTSHIIACQAPVYPFYNFWKAIFQYKIKVLIMLCSFQDPKRGKQADPYWDDQKDYVEQDIEVKVIKDVVRQKYQKFQQRTIEIKIGNQKHEFKHIHWYGWQDFGIPSSTCFNTVKQIAEQINNAIDRNQGVALHCSAGIGRTGTLLAIVDAIRGFKKSNNEKVSIYEIVKNLRTNRFGSVQTFEQYNFIYDFLRKYFKA